MADAGKVNRSLMKQKMGHKHLFWESHWHRGVLIIKAQSRVMLKGEISTHQFCPETHSAAELITASQSVSSVQTESMPGCSSKCFIKELGHSEHIRGSQKKKKKVSDRFFHLQIKRM